jgi:hypothetical protein
MGLLRRGAENGFTEAARQVRGRSPASAIYRDCVKTPKRGSVFSDFREALGSAVSLKGKTAGRIICCHHRLMIMCRRTIRVGRSRLSSTRWI